MMQKLVLDKKAEDNTFNLYFKMDLMCSDIYDTEIPVGYFTLGRLLDGEDRRFEYTEESFTQVIDLMENRFIPLKYQNFNSFIKCVTDLNMGGEEIEFYIGIANSFAYEVIHYLQKYIDDDLRQSIRLQFKIDMIEAKKLDNDFGDIVCDPQEKNMIFLSFIRGHFEYLYNNEEAREELEYLKNKFEDFN